LACDHSLSFGTHKTRFDLVEHAENERLGKLVLILPVPVSVWQDPHVENVIARVKEWPAYDERSLEVQVPTTPVPVSVPENLDRVSVAGTHKAKDRSALPDAIA
jgi:hypothetical protein